jgi:hypothetical protein
MTTPDRIPEVSGKHAIRKGSAPVIDPATASVIPAEALAVMNPDSAPVASAIVRLAIL